MKSPIPLAQDFIIVAESYDRENAFWGSPGIAQHSSGRIIATGEYFVRVSDAKETPATDNLKNQAYVFTSDDQGMTWVERSQLNAWWATPFFVEDTLYYIGVEPNSYNMTIYASEDGGESWGEPAKLFSGYFHTAPTAMVHLDGHVYKAWEWSAHQMIGRQIASVVSIGDADSDLTKPESWRLTNRVHYPGDLPMMNFRLYNPTSAPPWNHMTGWLEGNMVNVRGELKVFLRVWPHGPTNVAAMCSLYEKNGDNKLEFDWYCTFPGGVCKFYIQYDGESDLFWMTSNQPTDHLQDISALWKRGFVGVPANERRILNLYYSLDSLNWFQAGTVAMSADPLESFSYPSFIIDREDMLVLCRTSVGGKNQHDTNLITFHRVHNFRDFALDLHPRANAAAR